MDKFAASLAEDFNKPVNIRVNLEPEYATIEKVAGLTIYQPTAENIEQFVGKYIRDEVKAFPKALNISVNFVPTTASGGNKDYIDDGHGKITLKLHDAAIEIPFIVSKGDLVPFDIIQMKDQRIVYNRENLMKVLVGIDRMNQSPEMKSGDSPFLGTEKKLNNTTDNGFLRDVMQIRDSHVNQSSPVNNGGHYIYASDAFDHILEKTASIKQMTKEDYDRIEKVLFNKFAAAYIDEMEKIAAEDIDDKLSIARAVLGNIADMKWRSVHDMKNGQHIVFPEKDGNDITMTKAIVLKDMMLCRGKEEMFRHRKDESDYDKKQRRKAEIKENSVMIVTDSGKFTLLQNRAPFYAIETGDDWRLKTVAIESMKPDEIYTAIKGNNVVYPFNVAQMPENMGSTPEDRELQKTTVPKIFKIRCSEWGSERNFQIAEVPGADFDLMDRDDAIEVYSKFADIGSHELLQHMLPYGIFWGCDSNTQVIPLKGLVKDYLKSPEHLEFTQSDRLFKEAGMDTIKLECYDKERGIFDLEIQWRDTNLKIPKLIHKKFDKVRKGNVVGILRAANISATDVADLIARAERDNRAVKDMPAGATPDKIRGGDDVQGRVTKVMTTLKNKVLSDNNVDNIGAAIIGNQVANLIAGSDRALDVLDSLRKWASEAEVCAVHFEKDAQERDSEAALNVAKAMVACHKTANILKAAYEGKEFNFFKEAMNEVAKYQPEIEKMAYDLTKTKAMQFKLATEMVSPNILKAAVNCLDKLVKVANATTHSNLICEVCGGTAKDALLVNGKCPVCLTAEQDSNRSTSIDATAETQGDEAKISEPSGM